MHAVHVPLSRRAGALAAALAAAALSAGCAALDEETGAEAELAVAPEEDIPAPHLDPTTPPPLEDVDTSRMILDDPADIEAGDLDVFLEPPPETQLLAQP